MLKLTDRPDRKPPGGAVRDAQMHFDLGFVPRPCPIEEDYPVAREPSGWPCRMRDLFD